MTAYRDRIRELRRVRASDLLANPKNWRRHPAAQQSALRAVLERVGYADALLARETDNGLELIDGHLRAETTPDQDVPVLILDVDEAEADEILLTHDPLAAMAEADKDLLSELIHDFSAQDERLDALIADLAKENKIDLTVEGQTDPDDVPEPPAEPITKPGDLWLLGDHRLLCGDATSEADVARLLDGATPALMVTDPPYGVEYDPHWRDDIVGEFGKRDARGPGVANDEIVEWDGAWNLFPGAVAYVWHAGRHASSVQKSIEAARFEIRCQIIWAKQHFAVSRGHYHWRHEPCWYAVRKGASGLWLGDRTQSTLWEINSLNPAGRQEERLAHGTQKPVECMERPIRNHDAPEVYDPFVGSGTTIIAAERQRRSCYAMEIDPTYCDVAVKRWEQYTGGKAKRGK